MTGLVVIFPSAMATMVSLRSSIPMPSFAFIGTTGMPRAFSTFLKSIVMPFFFARSILFKAIITFLTPISRISIVK